VVERQEAVESLVAGGLAAERPGGTLGRRGGAGACRSGRAAGREREERRREGGAQGAGDRHVGEWGSEPGNVRRAALAKGGPSSSYCRRMAVGRRDGGRAPKPSPPVALAATL
jgi:hypothetical protein